MEISASAHIQKHTHWETNGFLSWISYSLRDKTLVEKPAHLAATYRHMIYWSALLRIIRCLISFLNEERGVYRTLLTFLGWWCFPLTNTCMQWKHGSFKSDRLVFAKLGSRERGAGRQAKERGSLLHFSNQAKKLFFVFTQVARSNKYDMYLNVYLQSSHITSSCIYSL